MKRLMYMTGWGTFYAALGLGIAFLASAAGALLELWHTRVDAFLAAYAWQLCMWSLGAAIILCEVERRVVPADFTVGIAPALRFFFLGWVLMAASGYAAILRPIWSTSFEPVWVTVTVASLAFYLLAFLYWILGSGRRVSD
jgi:hypothetical protein